MFTDCTHNHSGYIPFEYPEVPILAPQAFPLDALSDNRETICITPPLTRSHEGKYYMLVGTNLYTGPYNCRSSARRARQKIIENFSR